MSLEIIEILSKLISINTSNEISTLEAVNYIAHILDENDISYEIVKSEKDPLRASIIATIGDNTKPGIVLSGHLDTFGVKTQIKNWETNPFELKIKDNSLIGRGVVDMKGAIACVLSNINFFKQQTIPIHFVLTHDEEGGFSAINQLIQNRFYNKISPHQLGCIVMEPSNLSAIYSHEGYSKYILRIQTSGGKMLQGTQDVNALKYALQVCQKIERIFKNIDWQDKNAENNLNIGKLISGDNAFNIPKEAIIEFQFKYQHEDENKDKFIKHLMMHLHKMRWKAQQKKLFLDINMSPLMSVKPFNGIKHGKLHLAIEKSVPESPTLPFGTEAGYFQEHGINTVILGPGDYKYAHRSNETIYFSDLKRYQKILKNIIFDIQNLKTFMHNNLCNR